MRNTVTHEEVRTVKTYEEVVSCDLCGFDEDETYISKVVIAVDEDACVGTRITRDVCQDCYQDKIQPLIDPLFVVLKAGDEELTEAQEDRWYL